MESKSKQTRKYYIRYFKGFVNSYSLCSVEDSQDEMALQMLPGEWERITYEEAQNQIRSEKQRRKYNPAFAFYGDVQITPAQKLLENLLSSV